MPEHDPQADDLDLALLLDVAQDAGQIALRFWKKSPVVWEKPDGAGPVTEADLAVNDMLADRLQSARPNYGWLSEETPDTAARRAQRLATRRSFILDPIDGTRAFIGGEIGFSHALAVVENGQVVAAVVALPAMGVAYAATAIGPATRNGTAINVSTRDTLEGAQMLAARTNLDPKHWRGPPPLVDRIIRPSLAWRMCLVADGSCDAMLTLRPAWEWDIAAGDLIVQRAGGQVSTSEGRPIVYNSASGLAKNVVAAPKALHSQITARLLPPTGHVAPPPVFD